MGFLTFPGGVHPPDFKSYTSDKPIKEIWPVEKQLTIFPMSQHLGAPCESIVEKGEYVKIGQKIGEAKAFVCSPIFSSVSGTVIDIKDSLTPNGNTCKAVHIEYDGKREEHESINKPLDYKNLSKEEILLAIKEAGIVGLGGAGFPSHIKLNPPAEKKIDTILVNAAECEPFLTTDYRVMLEETEKLLEGLQIMLHLHKDAKGCIGIEANKPDCIQKLTEAAKKYEKITVVPLETKYPQGSEKQLILACTSREVPSGGLPADVGCIVHNVDTVIAIHRAILRGRPLMRKIMTVAGGAVNNPGNYKVRIGMLYKDIIESIGGYKGIPYKMISGGPMMGVSMFTDEVPVIKTSSGFLCLTEEEAKFPEEKNCIRCAKCVEHCPMHLLPLELNANVLESDFEAFRANNGLDCIECGVCSYVCPSKRHLAQSIRYARRDVLAKKL